MIASYLLAILLAYPAPDDAPPFPTAEPSAVGIDPTALERLKVRAAKAKSDAVLIVKDGKLIADWTFDKNTMQPGGLPTGQDGRVVRNKSPQLKNHRVGNDDRNAGLVEHIKKSQPRQEDEWRCVPGADRMWFDGDRSEIVLSIERQAQPFSNLSAGQRMMLALVADIAIKAVTQNNHLVPEHVPATANGALPDVLAQTPGVVLIDELDVHLHPRWQRRVATDLKSTFPRIQFVCTSHSPQVIGEVAPKKSECSTNWLSAAHPINLMGWTRIRSWKISWEPTRELRAG